MGSSPTWGIYAFFFFDSEDLHIILFKYTQRTGIYIVHILLPVCNRRCYQNSMIIDVEFSEQKVIPINTNLSSCLLIKIILPLELLGTTLNIKVTDTYTKIPVGIHLTNRNDIVFRNCL